MSEEVLEKIRLAGVVGAGGASFPAYIKLSSKVDIVIANGSECEPLIYTDKTLLAYYPEKVIAGLKIAMELTGATKGVIAIKEKNREAIDAVKNNLKNCKDITLHLLDDYYPAGDEQNLVYEVTRRIVPEGGIPPQIGVLVHNVATLINIHEALEGSPVTERFLTVNGEVGKPSVFRVPLGTTYKDLIGFAGGTKLKDPVIIDGGPMMGEVKTDLDDSITKATSGIVILDKEAVLIKKKTVKSQVQILRAKSVCDQCQLCTDLCPRYLLGHNLYPHKMMRAISYERALPTEDITQSYLCCFCNLCFLYACPTGISPSAHLKDFRSSLIKNGVKNPHREKPSNPREFFKLRKVESSMLTQKLGLDQYSMIKPKVSLVHLYPSFVKIKLKQHPGNPAVPTVRLGDVVKKGEMIATTQKGDFSAPIHASIDGKIQSINSEKIVISKWM